MLQGHLTRRFRHEVLLFHNSRTPVIATNIWGTPEVVSLPAAGVLMAERADQALADAWAKLFAQYPPRAATRAHAETFSWDATTQGQLRLFAGLLQG